MSKRWLIVVAAVLFPAAAFAQAIEVSWVGQVKFGQQPKLKIVVRAPALRVEILLHREDGKLVDETLGDLGDNGWREVMLDGSLGRHTYSGRVTCVSDGKPSSVRVEFETYVVGAIALSLPRPRLEDLTTGHMEIRTGIGEGKAQLVLISAADNEPVLDHVQAFTTHDPGDPLILNFKPVPKATDIGRVDVRVIDPTGAYETKSFSPWMVTIPHEEVNFATDQAAVAPAEAPKLQASFGLITEALNKNPGVVPRLFIAGHTDTVGAAPYNLALSRKRAAAIAAWFRKNGLHIAIAYEGFGEHALRVPTPDNTNEPKNRRVDYILAVEEPVLKATDFRPSWKLVL